MKWSRRARRRWRFRFVALASLVLLVGLSAGAGVAPAAQPKPGKPQTLVATYGKIYAFAQDRDAVSWVGGGRVHVRRLSSGKAWIVGRISRPERAPSAVLAIAGSRALWSWDDGGNSTEYPVVTSAPGRAAVTIDTLGGGVRYWGDGRNPTGLAGDGSILAYGWVNQSCPTEPLGICHPGPGPMAVTGGGVSIETRAAKAAPYWPPLIPNVPPPALFAVSQSAVAVAPARLSTSVGMGPRVAEDGPVEVYDLRGKLMGRVPMFGLVRDLALSGRTLSVLLERYDGSKILSRFDASSGKQLFGALVPTETSDLSASTGGTIFRAGRNIYALGAAKTRLIAHAAAIPIGLSIEGRRIAWAENIRGRGRIVSLRLSP